MKLKLFIITIIVASFAMIGLLGGCGGNSGRNGQDNSIAIDMTTPDNTTHSWGTVNGERALTYHKDGEILFLLVYRTLDDNELTIDTVYTTNGKTMRISCSDLPTTDRLDFTATSSDKSVAFLSQIGTDTYTVTAGIAGKATISITTDDNRKTSFTVIVVDSESDMPDLAKEIVIKK